MFTISLRWQRFLNFYIFLNVAGYFAWKTWEVLAQNRLDFIVGVFIAHNIVLCLCFLLRRPARGLETRISHQAVAICAFYSGAFFMGPENAESSLLLGLAFWLTLLGLIISILALLRLGKSFGVLIALREVKTSGVYALVRHPMYLSDIVLRLAYLCGHPGWLSLGLFLVSSACYVLRARLEEAFLAEHDPAYADYMKRVRYRFIPGLF